MEHNKDPEWLKKVKEKLGDTPKQENVIITAKELKRAIVKLGKIRTCFFSLWERVVLNKLWLGKVQGQTGSPSKYFSFSMYCVGDMDGCMKVAIFLR